MQMVIHGLSTQQIIIQIMEVLMALQVFLAEMAMPSFFQEEMVKMVVLNS